MRAFKGGRSFFLVELSVNYGSLKDNYEQKKSDNYGQLTNAR